MFVDKNQCSGCGLCAEYCPVHALSMKTDKYGFMYPVLEENKCINCNLCERVCAFNKQQYSNIPQNIYISQHVSENVCVKSTSGGMFTAISDAIFDMSGVIYAPMFDDNMSLKHMRIIDAKHRDLARGSKYVQSDISSIYHSLVDDLEKGNKVALFGTPCQIAGIRKKFHSKYEDRLCLIDVVCNGVSSPKVWEQHIKRIEETKKKKVINYNFRPKTNGYLTQTEIAYFSDGSVCEYTYAMSKYNSLYYSGLLMRPSCTNCTFCDIKRLSDITIADFSKETKLILPFEKKNGASTLLINTNKGRQLFDSFKQNITYVETDIFEIDQKRLHKCSEAIDGSEEFIYKCIQQGINSAIKTKYSKFRRLKSYIAALFYRIRNKCLIK